MTFAGNYAITDVYARTHQFFAAENNIAEFSGAISGGTASATVLKKTGSGTVVFSGSSANTYSSDTPLEVVAGTLILKKTAGVNAISGGVKVDSGAILQLGASNQIANTGGLNLAGGKFDSATFSETLGALTLTGNSTISLGSGASVAFASSVGLWTSGMTLTISGIIDSTSLRFGSNASGLSAGQLGQIVFANYADSVAGLDSNGYSRWSPSGAECGSFVARGLRGFGVDHTHEAALRPPLV